MKEKPAFKAVSLIAAVLVVIVAAVLPNPDGLTFDGKMMIGFLLAAIILWITEALPIVVTTWFVVASVPLLGIMEPVAVWQQGVSPAMVLFLSCFVFAVFFSKSTLATRVTGFIFKWAGNDPKKTLLGFMVATALISSVVDNLPLTLVMLALAYSALDANGTPWGNKSNLAKCMALGIPFAAYIGGWITPVGCVMNVMCLSFAESTLGVTISFVNWMVIGLLIAVIALPITWLVLVKVFKPEPITDDAIKKVEGRIASLGGLSVGERGGLAIILLTVILWIAGSWISVLNTAVVGLVALGLMFLPGLKAVSYKDYVSESPWDVVFLTWGVGCFVAGVTATGAMDWMVGSIFGSLSGLPLVAIMALLAIFACILHNILPSGAAVAGLITIPIVSLIASLGGNVSAGIFLASVFSAAAFLLPLDAVIYIPYMNERKYFLFGDVAKVGWAPSLALICLFAFVVPGVCSLMGLM